MKDEIRKKIDNIHSLVKLFTSAVLVAHFSACAWIFIGKLNENSWVNVLENGIEVDGEFQPPDDQWQYYGAYEEYVFALYWVFTVLTTVGYGDFTGGEIPEYIYTMFLEFAGISFFAALTGLLTSLVTTGKSYE